MVLWGSSFIALKVAVTEMNPMVVVFIRMAIGAMAFAVVWPWLRQQFRYQSGDWKYLLGMALFEPCLYFIFEAQALKYTSAGQAGMVTAMLPLMVAIAAFFFLKESNSKRQWFGFMLAVVGVVIMTLTGEDSTQAPNAILGNVLEFLAMCSAVGYTLLVKHLVSRYPAFLLTALQSFVGTAFFLPFALFADWPESISLELMSVLIYLGLVISLGAYGLYNFSLTHLKASTAAGYTNLLPVFSLAFSVVLLDEHIVLAQWGAIVLVFAGVALTGERPRKTAEVPPAVTG
ncbi:MAG: DMT family transporter [Pseudomonadales bacterium]|uniref:DME family DMT superfamily transporter n=2 Tax=Oleiphilus messinensis TaxID=141451 RepID=A0A1Y0IDA4_9GAMM|nr:DME family DMT superfamily transporter [Oleiphilus messinensis]MCG8612699.1 DMT family transporter [Pseudomonadales bacterium]